MVKGNFWCVKCTCGETEISLRSFKADIDNPDSEESVYCPNNHDLELKLLGTEAFTLATHDRIRGKGRSEKEKAERRKKSFHEQVSTQVKLDPGEKSHFEKKFGKPS